MAKKFNFMALFNNNMHKNNIGTMLSPDRKYRYVLFRCWDIEKTMVNFVALNPSTADESKDDPTLRRCMSFAKSFGYGGLYITNLFAFRATRFVMYKPPYPNDFAKLI